MAALNIRIIQMPDLPVWEMIARKVPSDVRKSLGTMPSGAVALIQTSIPNILYFADVACKAAEVIPSEIAGNCPQHMSTLALFGDISAVKIAVESIEQENKEVK